MTGYLVDQLGQFVADAALPDIGGPAPALLKRSVQADGVTVSRR